MPTTLSDLLPAPSPVTIAAGAAFIGGAVTKIVDFLLRKRRDDSEITNARLHEVNEATLMLIKGLQSQVASFQNDIRALRTELDSLEKRYTASKQRVSDLESQLAELKKLVGDRPHAHATQQ